MSSFSAAGLGSRQGARPGQGAADHGDEFLQVEGLRQVLVGAALGGLDGRHEGVLGAHDDDGKLRPQLLDPGQSNKAFAGIMTSVITRVAFPCATQRQRVAALLVERTS